MATTNFHIISSVENFQELLSADLERVSLLNFWAPWAEPCKEMNTLAQELAIQYPKLLVLQIEAEEQADIAESFDVQEVPTTILLRGHTLLGRLSGLDPPKLKELVAQNVTSTPKATNLKSAPPVISEKTPEETPEQLNKRLRSLMNKGKVVLFMKGNPEKPQCGFSRKITALLRDQGVEYEHFDILTDDSVRQGLKKLNDWPTFPQLIINGELVGGLDIVQEMADSGELKELVA